MFAYYTWLNFELQFTHSATHSMAGLRLIKQQEEIDRSKMFEPRPEPVVGMLKMPTELLVEGLKVYETLKAEVEKAKDLRRYADKLEQINQVMAGVRKLLSEEEKDIADDLVTVHDLTQLGIHKAVVLVHVIKTQCEVLRDVLHPSSASTAKEQNKNLYLACVYFAKFAKATEVRITEAEEAILKASNKLFSAKLKIGTITHTLHTIQDKLVYEQKVATTEANATTVPIISGATAVTALLLGPLGLVLSGAGIVRLLSLHNYIAGELGKNFQEQCKKIEEHIAELNKMKTETDSLKTSLDEKRESLTQIDTKLSAAVRSVAGTEWDMIESVATDHFNTLHDLAKNLCESFKAVLQSLKT